MRAVVAVAVLFLVRRSLCHSVRRAGSCVIHFMSQLRYPRARVQYSKVKVGTIGSTFGEVNDEDDDEDDEYGDNRRLDEVLI